MTPQIIGLSPDSSELSPNGPDSVADSRGYTPPKGGVPRVRRRAAPVTVHMIDLPGAAERPAAPMHTIDLWTGQRVLPGAGLPGGAPTPVFDAAQIF